MRGGFPAELGMSQKAEHVQPVIHSHSDNASSGHALAIVTVFRTVTCRETTAVEINQHRQTFFGRFGRGPHVEVQAIFAYPVGAKYHVAENIALHSSRTELVCLAHARPLGWWNGRFPAQLAYGRLGEWNPLKRLHACGWVERSLKNSGYSLDLVLSQGFRHQFGALCHGNN